jgi:hypothetical protein
MSYFIPAIGTSRAVEEEYTEQMLIFDPTSSGCVALECSFGYIGLYPPVQVIAVCP